MVEEYNMKKSQQLRIERIVNARAKLIQEQVRLSNKKAMPLNEWPDWLPSYDDVASFLTDYAGNVPVIGKIPGAVGGVMKMGKGAVTGDWDMVRDGGIDTVFTGIPGGGAVTKNVIKNITKDGTKSAIKNVAKDSGRLYVKNQTKPHVKNYFSDIT